jgi:glycosyltransferase involved in cell wall biosynthesis
MIIPLRALRAKSAQLFEPRKRPPQTVLVVGPGPDCRGGISAVLGAHSRLPVWSKRGCVWLATSSAGTRIGQLFCFARALLSALVQVPRASIVHVHTASQRSFYRKAFFILIARLYRKKVLLHVHGGGFGEFCESVSPPARFVLRESLKAVSVVVAVSQTTAEVLRPHMPGLPICVVPNTYSLAACSSTSVAGVPAILYAGRIEPAKGVSDLLRAFARVHQAMPSCRLIVAGEGDVQSALDLARNLGIESAVTFPGWLTGQDLSAAFQSATVFCLPSYCEALPTSLLQAMGTGLPVVATAVGGVPEYIEPERTGILVEPGDVDDLAAQLTRLLSDPALRARLAEAAKVRVASVSPEHVSELLDSLYESISWQTSNLADSTSEATPSCITVRH